MWYFIYDNTHRLKIKTKDNIIYINPVLISGSLPLNKEKNSSSFILKMLQGSEVTIFSYVLKAKSKKFIFGQIRCVRGDEIFKIDQNIEEENLKE